MSIMNKMFFNYIYSKHLLDAQRICLEKQKKVMTQFEENGISVFYWFFFTLSTNYSQLENDSRF